MGREKSSRERASDGKYTVAVNAKNINNDSIPVTLKTTARVTGINIKSDDGALFTEMGEVGFDQISSVGTGDFKQSLSKLNRIQLEHKAKATQSTLEDLQKLSVTKKKKKEEVQPLGLADTKKVLETKEPNVAIEKAQQNIKMPEVIKAKKPIERKAIERSS